MFLKESQFQEIEVTNVGSLSKPQINISVLRHLSKPLQILDKDESYLNFSNPICCYTEPLHSIPQKILPTQQNTQKQQVQQTRLISMQTAQTEFQQVKRMFQRSRFRTEQDNNNNDQQDQKCYIGKTKTLYNMFCLKSPYYCRFQNHKISKNNFANVFLNVAGLNLEAKMLPNAKKSSAITKFPKVTDRQRLYNTGNLVFDSSFQSGNLLYVYQQSPETEQDNLVYYQLILQNDTNTYGHNQWFFFRVQSLKPHMTIRFSIINLIKSESLFNYGLKPLVFSERENTTKKIGWQRRGQNIKYYQNDIRRQNIKQNYFTLQFEYSFRETKDWVYFCPSYPYTYTQMTTYIQNLYVQPDFKKCFSVKTICETLGKNKINLITVSTGQKSIDQCKIIWVLARQHPAETTGSYMVEGMMRYLLPLISSAKDSDDNSVLSKLHDYVFKIIPIVNVDGVIHGNSRAQLVGLDPNRQWKKPRKCISPSTYYILREILTYKKNVSLVLDLHSHSKKTGCFFYGNQMVQSSKLSRIYPTLVCENDQRFVLKNCRFRGGYRTTARHILFKQIGCQNIFTVECSLLGYMNKKTNRITQYTIQDYHEMGAKLIENFFKLQNIKLQKGVNQLIQEFNQRIQQVCDIDSAKSDSGVSDDQYEEVKQLEKRSILLKKKKYQQQCDKKANKSIVSAVLKHQMTSNDKPKPRAFSFAKHRNRNISTRAQQNNTSFALPYYRSDSKPKRQPIQKDNISNTQIISNSQKEILRNTTTKLQSPKINTFMGLKQSYKKYLANSKTNAIEKTSIQDATRTDFRVKTDQGVQVAMDKKNHDKKILQPHQNTQNALLMIADPKIRPLLILGNTCQADYAVFNKNQISIQVSDTQNDSLKKQNKMIAKLPKLMSLIASSKENMNKISYGASKQNQNLLAPVSKENNNTLMAAKATRLSDIKSAFSDENQKKAKPFNNSKYLNA